MAPQEGVVARAPGRKATAHGMGAMPLTLRADGRGFLSVIFFRVYRIEVNEGSRILSRFRPLFIPVPCLCL